jgi:hypothetical protein
MSLSWHITTILKNNYCRKMAVLIVPMDAVGSLMVILVHVAKLVQMDHTLQNVTKGLLCRCGS